MAFLDLARFGGGSPVGRGALCRRVFLRSSTLLIRAPLFGDAAVFFCALFGCALLGRDALLFRAMRLFGDASLFRSALLFLDASRFLRGAFLFRCALCCEALFFGTLGGEAFLLRALRLSGLVDGGEDLFVLNDHEGLLVLEGLLRYRRRSDLERLLRERWLSRLGLRGDGLIDNGFIDDGLVDRRPALFDARLGV
ncbi:MAG: hypothetical protein M3O80_05030 [Chloroflexota bacterium]|nr:hypothetical protein [Chloroflexota bacterium]